MTRRGAADLQDCYVRDLVWRSIGHMIGPSNVLEYSDIPQQWIDARRESMRAKRELWASWTPEMRRARRLGQYRASYLKNKDRAQAWAREYYRKHRDEVLAYNRSHYLRNRDRELDYARKYQMANKERIAERNKQPAVKEMRVAAVSRYQTKNRQALSDRMRDRYRAGLCKTPDPKRRREINKAWRLRIPDSYVVEKIIQRTKIPAGSVPQWMIGLHRTNLQAKRLLVKQKQAQ